MVVPTQSELFVAHAVLYSQRFEVGVIPMVSGEKKPAIPWKEFQERRATVREIMGWPKENLAIVTGAISGIVVVDCDSMEASRWWYKHRPHTPVMVRTKRGVHFYYRHPGVPVQNKVRIDDKYDVKGDGGYALAPPSQHSEGRYRWIGPLMDPCKLPLFYTEWRPVTPYSSGQYEKKITDGAAYISRIFAVAGQRGHDETWRAVNRLRDAGYSEAEAFAAMLSWNRTNADPPWSEQDLLHKVRDVYTRRQ